MKLFKNHKYVKYSIDLKNKIIAKTNSCFKTFQYLKIETKIYIYNIYKIYEVNCLKEKLIY